MKRAQASLPVARSPHVTEERVLRAEFQAEHAQYIPEDLCLFVENMPNQWTISTLNDEPLEALPLIDNDLIQDVSSYNGSEKTGVSMRY